MKKLICSLFAITISSLFAIAQETSELGLGERRALKEYQDKQFPDIEKAIKTAAGFNVPLEVKWEQLAKVGQADLYKKDAYWGTTIFQPLTKALSAITIDQMGKDALKSKLKKIVIMHDKETAPLSNFPNGLKWEAGVLTINFTPYENAAENYMKERIEAIQKFIESKL
jgi:hypothetical protein